MLHQPEDVRQLHLVARITTAVIVVSLAGVAGFLHTIGA